MESRDTEPMDFETLFRQFQTDDINVPAPSQFVESVSVEDSHTEYAITTEHPDQQLHNPQHNINNINNTSACRGIILMPNHNGYGEHSFSVEMGEMVHDFDEPHEPVNVTMPVDTTPSVIISHTGEPQMVIPVNMDDSVMGGSETMLLQVVPTLVDGRIEMRISGNAILQPPPPPPQFNTSVEPVPLTLPEPVTNICVQPEIQEHQRYKLVIVGENNQRETVFDFPEMETTPVNDDDVTDNRFNKKAQVFKCDLCDYTNPRRYLVVRHKKSHSDHRPHACTICPAKFKTLASLHNHYNTHTGLKPYLCQDCPMTFTTSGELVRHCRYKHTKEKPHKCPDCDYATVELSKLKRHLRSHTGERPYACTYCIYTSSDSQKLRRHMRIHSGEKPYECHLCLARFSQSNSLKAHQLTHDADRPSFACSICPTVCGRRNDLKTHIAKMHTASEPIGCPKCNRKFTDRYSFKLHKKGHTNEKCFKCKLCPYAAAKLNMLQQHVLVHSEVKSFKCEEPDCDASFRQKAQLLRHSLSKHNPDRRNDPSGKTHKCPQCSQEFRYEANLKKHIQSHLAKVAAVEKSDKIKMKAILFLKKRQGRKRSKKSEGSKIKRSASEISTPIRKKSLTVNKSFDANSIDDNLLELDVEDTEDVLILGDIESNVDDSFGFDEIAHKLKKSSESRKNEQASTS